MPGVTAHLDQMRAVILDQAGAAPQPALVTDHWVHASPTCTRYEGSGEGHSPDQLFDLALENALHACRCTAPHPWMALLCESTLSLPEHILAHPDAADAVHHRRICTPDWLHVDPLESLDQPEAACCGLEPWTNAPTALLLSQLAARHTHSYLTAAAAAHGQASTWIAIGYDQLHDPNPDQDLPDTALAPLALFHPWATVTHNGIGIVLFHLPEALARNALARGAEVIPTAHVSLASWPVARRLLQATLEQPRQTEAVCVAAAAELFEVAHTATH